MKELQRRIDSAEFAEWLAEYQIEPWGEDWKQTAVLQSTLINLNCKRKVKVEECLPGRAAKRKQSDSEMQARLDMFFKAMLRKQQRKEAMNGEQRQ